MAPDLVSSVWKLPGASQFVAKAGQDLADGISLLVVFPPTADLPGFQHLLFRHLEFERYLDVRQVDLSDADGEAPFDILCRALLSAGDAKYLEQLVTQENLPDVVVVSSLENCSVKDQQNWLDAFTRWVGEGRRTGSRRSLIYILQAQYLPPLKLPSEVGYRVWVGIPSILEVRLLCRLHSTGIDDEAQWREYMLASLVGNDLRLGEKLWKAVFEGEEAILAELTSYAAEQQWTEAVAARNLTNGRFRPPGLELHITPKDNGFEKLSQGMTIYTAEYGEETHPAILAILGRRPEIIHRIWRAQAALLLPLIDDIRRDICDVMTARHGNRWAIIEQEYLDPPLELGKLKFYFNSLPDSSWEKREWNYGIYQTWRTRNNLAHYQPVPYSWFRDLWGLSRSIHKVKSERG